MKKYKYKRKQEEHRKQNPNKVKRTKILVQTTKEIALERFRQIHDDKGWVWYPPNNSTKDMFEIEFYRLRYDDFNFQVEDLGMMFPYFLKCLKALEEKKRKADYLKKTYVPLEEDLFHVN